MGIFTLDVGSGTQDFLLYPARELDCKIVRDSLKAILPSPTRIVASKIRRSKDIFLYGYTMGGGMCKKAAVEHAKKHRVFCTEKAALSFSDDLEKVRKWGIEIVDSVNGKVTPIEMRDVDWEFFFKLSDLLCEVEKAVVAVQDHGFCKGSNRRFRFSLFEKALKKGATLKDFVYESERVPEVYTRMRSVVESYEDFKKETGRDFELYVVDTVFAAVAGCHFDAKEFPALLLNFGNSHFVGAVVGKDGEIYSMFEHHTKVIAKRGKDWIRNFVEEFVKGRVDFEDVFNDGGHGAYVREVVDVKDYVATGPRVELSPYRIANSCGDIMITGNVGMLSLL